MTLGLMMIVLAATVWQPPARARLRDDRWQPWWQRLGQEALSRVRGSWRRGSKAAARRRAAADVVLALSAELSTGLPLDVALRRAGADRDFMVRSVGAVRVGGDVPAALRTDAQEFDLAVLAALAAVWQVSAGSGAGLSDAAYRLGAAALQRERLRRDLASQMAGPKATARVLALLPLIGLVLGSGIGGSPFAWLLGTPAGWGVLIVGLTLEVVGVLWVRRLVGQVEKHL
ncbi:MAG: tight adherence protein [Actinomycetota bacterium]|nr:tight adherence protein [Actinomycetota bacterium]